MSAIWLNLGCSKSGGKRPEVVERMTLPTEDRPAVWWAVVMAIIAAGVIFLHAVPKEPRPLSPAELERKFQSLRQG